MPKGWIRENKRDFWIRNNKILNGKEVYPNIIVIIDGRTVIIEENSKIKREIFKNYKTAKDNAEKFMEKNTVHQIYRKTKPNNIEYPHKTHQVWEKLYESIATSNKGKPLFNLHDNYGSIHPRLKSLYKRLIQKDKDPVKMPMNELLNSIEVKLKNGQRNERYKNITVL